MFLFKYLRLSHACSTNKSFQLNTLEAQDSNDLKQFQSFLPEKILRIISDYYLECLKVRKQNFFILSFALNRFLTFKANPLVLCEENIYDLMFSINLLMRIDHPLALSFYKYLFNLQMTEVLIRLKISR